MNQATNNTIYGLDVKTTIDNTTFLILNIAFEHFFKPLPRHSHGNNSYELHYIPNGLGQAVIDGSSYELTPGTLYMTSIGLGICSCSTWGPVIYLSLIHI